MLPFDGLSPGAGMWMGVYDQDKLATLRGIGAQQTEWGGSRRGQDCVEVVFEGVQGSEWCLVQVRTYPSNVPVPVLEPTLFGL